MHLNTYILIRATAAPLPSEFESYKQKTQSPNDLPTNSSMDHIGCHQNEHVEYLYSTRVYIHTRAHTHTYKTDVRDTKNQDKKYNSTNRNGSG